MAEREAKVRLNLAAAGIASQLQALVKQSKELEQAVEDIGDGAAKADRKTTGFFTAMKAGAGAARGTLADLGGQLKNTLTMAATLGGSLSIGAAAKEAQEVVGAYKDLAFAIRVGTGEAVTWQQVQGQVETTATRWKRSTKEVQQAYADLFAETGNLQFAKASIDSVAMAANATGKATKTWSDIAGTLNEKFGIGADRIQDSLAAAVELTNKGGASAEELADKLGIVGASAKLLGMQGEDGFKRLLGMINMADDSTGTMKQKFGAVSNVLEQMADPERLKQIEKALGVKLTDSKGGARDDAIQRIIAKTKGEEGELRKAFGATEVKLVSSMAKPFVEAFANAKGTVEQRTAAALEAYGRALDEAGKVAFTGADLQEEANKRNNDGQRNMQAALNKFVKAFEKPQMVRAMDQLAEAAPAVAEAFAKLVGFAVKHPILAGAAVVGGMAGGSFLKGAAGSALQGLGEKGAKAAWEGGAKIFTESVSKSGGWATAGKALGVAAAALIAFELGKHAIDGAMNEDLAKQHSLQDASSTAESMAKHGTGTPEQRAQAAKKLREKIAQAEKDGGPGVVTSAFGNASKLFGGEDPEEVFQRDLDNARKQLKALESGKRGQPIPLADALAPSAPSAPSGPSPEAQKIAKEVANGEPRKVAISNEQALAGGIARMLSSTTLNVRVQGGGGPGTNGLPAAPGNGSGSTPKS
jgi:hypothetical protein